ESAASVHAASARKGLKEEEEDAEARRGRKSRRERRASAVHSDGGYSPITAPPPPTHCRALERARHAICLLIKHARGLLSDAADRDIGSGADSKATASASSDFDGNRRRRGDLHVEHAVEKLGFWSVPATDSVHLRHHDGRATP
uniref:E3 ubiquitin-protein ligase n=1 Tax=Macrostomum lignano TaxID=282301 RepID=A0A1I8F439_9PLAT